MIEIMNLRATKPGRPYDFGVHRRSPVGNPFTMYDELERDIVCDKYEIFFNTQLEMGNPSFTEYVETMLAAYKEHGRLRLFCWCAPKRCHAETIKKWILKRSQSCSS